MKITTNYIQMIDKLSKRDCSNDPEPHKKYTSRKVIKRVLVRVEDPNIKSHASLILLNRDLRDKELIGKTDITSQYLTLRWSFLNKRKELNGSLTCDFCGKPHLDIGLDDMLSYKNRTTNSKNKNLATIDHFFAVKDFPEYYLETRNWVVSCKSCNGKKSCGNPFKWLRKNKIEFHIPAKLEELIQSSSKLLHMKFHEKTGYRHPNEYKHIREMKKLYKKVS